MRKEHSHGRKVLKLRCETKQCTPGQTQHPVASDLVLHCLLMSYLQIFRQLITYANSLDPGQAQLVRTVLTSKRTKGKRKIIHERKGFLA